MSDDEDDVTSFPMRRMPTTPKARADLEAWKARALAAEADLANSNAMVRVLAENGAAQKMMLEDLTAKLAAAEARAERAERETERRIVEALAGLSDQYADGDMVEQCDFTAEGIAIGAEFIRSGEWKKGGG